MIVPTRQGLRWVPRADFEAAQRIASNEYRRYWRNRAAAWLIALAAYLWLFT